MTGITASDASKIFANTAKTLRATTERAPITGAELCVELLARMTRQAQSSDKPEDAVETFVNLPADIRGAVKNGMRSIPPLGAKRPRQKEPGDYNVYSRLRYMLKMMRSPQAVEPETRLHFAVLLEAMSTGLLSATNADAEAA